MNKLIGWYRDEGGQMRVEEGVFNPIDNTYTFTQKIEYYTDPIAASPMSITLIGNGEVLVNGQPTTQTQTDCRSKDGTTVGLIDSIITSARVLRERDMSAHAVKEALKDLASDEDVAWLIQQSRRA